jgi:3-phosphoshikimate 1-carboxyvinyltransferase
MKWRVRPSSVGGNVRLPGDKSLGHRALMLAAMAAGRSEIRNLSHGADIRSTISCLRTLGVDIRTSNDATVVESNGTLSEPRVPLDAGNSGTTMRLLCGILAGQPFESCLDGDASLCRRPMGRVIAPLELMGASIESVQGHAPLRLRGGSLHGVAYRSPVASAQVKSAVLLAGLYATGTTSVTEPVPSRDHTERMLTALGVPVRVVGTTSTLEGGKRPSAFSTRLPGDPSSAAFFLAAAALTGGETTVRDMLLNDTRLGFVRALETMGVVVETAEDRQDLGERAGNIRVSGTVRTAISISEEDVPSLVDELPLVALLATQADGVSEMHGAGELRVKETDRIQTTVAGLRALGADIDGLPDGFVVRGPRTLRGSRVSSNGDHRVAMMLAVAGLVATGTTTIDGAEAANVSFPDFAPSLHALGASIDSE